MRQGTGFSLRFRVVELRAQVEVLGRRVLGGFFVIFGFLRFLGYGFCTRISGFWVCYLGMGRARAREGVRGAFLEGVASYFGIVRWEYFGILM